MAVLGDISIKYPKISLTVSLLQLYSIGMHTGIVHFPKFGGVGGVQISGENLGFCF